MRGAIARRRAPIPLLPTQLTLANAVCGFGSLTLAVRPGTPDVADERLFYAGLLVLAAMVFDVLDGHVARMFHQTSRFGSQLDSLCDVVSFGLAPAFLVLHSTSVYHPRLQWFVSVLYVICVLLRLARFNSELADDDSHLFFSGLPSPAAAGMIASFALSTPTLTSMTYADRSPFVQQLGEWLLTVEAVSLPIVTVTLSILMVSRIRYPHLSQWIRGRRQFHDLAHLVFFIVAACAVHELVIPLIFLSFVVGSPVRTAWINPLVREARRIQPRRRRWTGRDRYDRMDRSRRDAFRGWRRRLSGRLVTQNTKQKNGHRDGHAKDTFPRK